MGITGSIIVYVMIWWIVSSILPTGIQSNDKPYSENTEGIDPGAPKNPRYWQKSFYSQLSSRQLFFSDILSC